MDNKEIISNHIVDK